MFGVREEWLNFVWSFVGANGEHTAPAKVFLCDGTPPEAGRIVYRSGCQIDGEKGEE